MRRVNVSLANLSTGQTNGTLPVVNGPGCLTWHSTYETTGSATASYQLSDGTTANSTLLAYVTLQAGQSTRDYIGLHCLPFVQGLWYTLETGAVKGTLVCWAGHVCEKVLDHHQMLLALQTGVDLRTLRE